MKTKTDTNCLNALKFLAACIVAFTWHYQHFDPANGSPFSSVFIWSYAHGWMMVELFFMLSGFGMFLGYFDRIRNHEIRFRDYIGKRVRKIYPMFFVTLCLITVLEIWYKSQAGDTFVYENFDLLHFIANLFLCQGGVLGTDMSFNGPSWYITICFLMYIIFYIVVYITRSEKAVIFEFLVLSVLGIFLIKRWWKYPLFMNTFTGRGLACFSVGVLVANVYKYCTKLCSRVIGYSCLLLLIALYTLYAVKNGAVNNFQLGFIICIGPAIILSILFVPWLNGLLSLKPFACLGSLSTEVFLFHFPVQCLIRNVDICFSLNINYSKGSIWILYVALTLLVSVLYEIFAEKKSERAFERLFGLCRKTGSR